MRREFRVLSRLHRQFDRAPRAWLLCEDESIVGAGDLNYGYHSHMEPQGSESVARQFPDDPNGNIYRKRRPSTDLAYRGGDVDAYLDHGILLSRLDSQHLEGEKRLVVEAHARV